MNHLQHKVSSDFTGINILVLALALVAIGFSLAAPREVNLVPWGPSPNPYAITR